MLQVPARGNRARAPAREATTGYRFDADPAPALIGTGFPFMTSSLGEFVQFARG